MALARSKKGLGSPYFSARSLVPVRLSARIEIWLVTFRPSLLLRGVLNDMALGDVIDVEDHLLVEPGRGRVTAPVPVVVVFVHDDEGLALQDVAQGLDTVRLMAEDHAVDQILVLGRDLQNGQKHRHRLLLGARGQASPRY